MMASLHHLLALCLYFAVDNVDAVNPGLRLQISQGGLNYASQLAVNLLSESILKLPLPYIKGKTKEHHFKIEYELSNMAITSFGKPSTSVSVLPGRGMQWSISGASLSISGHWRLKWRYHFIHKTDHGSFSVSADGISFNLVVSMGMDKSHRPTISSPSCSANVAHVKAKFHGGKLSWLYNLFNKQVAKMIQKQLRNMICKKAQEAVNINAEKKLANMKVLTKLGKYWDLDYSLVSPPVFGKNYVQTSHKAEVYWRKQHSEAPFPAPGFPPEVTGTKMLYMRMSNYVLNTLGYTATTHGVVKRYLTAKDLPADKRSFLNTTCRIICIGSIIPQLKKVAGASVEIGMNSTVPPHFSIDPAGISGNLSGQMQFNARKPDGSLAPLFSASTNLTLVFNATLKNGNVTGFVKTLKFTFHVTRSEVGKIPDASLDHVLQFVSDNYLKKEINDMAGVGIPIPNLDNVQLVKPLIQFEKGALRIGTDVRYQPKRDNSVLYYEPAGFHRYI